MILTGSLVLIGLGLFIQLLDDWLDEDSATLRNEDTDAQ